jgi:hypothetical protein
MRVGLPGVRFESSNCQNFLIEVEWEDAAAWQGAPLPKSLYVKLPCEELGTRAFANALGFCWPSRSGMHSSTPGTPLR